MSADGVRRCTALLVVAAALSACGSSSSREREGARSAKGHSAAADARIESCVDRFLRRATQDTDDDVARRYVRDTYCARFERNGWIHDDGVLRIGAHTWAEEGATCATGSEGQPPRTVPCEELDPVGTRRLDCALLHHVRRSEVQEYVERLRLKRPVVACDDGTPVDELGVP